MLKGLVKAHAVPQPRSASEFGGYFGRSNVGSGRLTLAFVEHFKCIDHGERLHGNQRQRQIPLMIRL